ncbi:PIN domain-containing protein [Candidatus Poribacteria bacterium]|nr:PIN domain-containing protein [Candidatus Poribacteria bacterium]
MNYKAAEVRNYNFTDEDQLFLDTNIWFYIFGPQEPKYQRNRWMRIYSGAFKRILKAKSQIYIDVLVLSEFINRYARLKWNVDAPLDTEFKDFRTSQDFELVARNITADVKRLLNHCIRIKSGFAALDIDALLNDYATGDFDFNDQVITEICKNNRFTLITNDSDFKTQAIPILTANHSLLRN